MSSRSAPVGGRILTPPFLVLLGFVVVAAALLLWRFIFGLGSVTALTDVNPWGLWIAWDVVVGTGLATGGYAMAILVYAFNRGHYHPLVRSALVTSALGYSLAGISVVIDLGRWWNVWRVPFFGWEWNLESVLLEVALCIMLYTVVLWIELAPAFLERFEGSGSERMRSISRFLTPKLERALPFVIALGILLPTMHQSSLGSLMLLAGDKVHALWQTPLLPLLFLVSCIPMGYAAVIAESQLAQRAFGLPSERKLLWSLRNVMAFLLVAYLVVRLADLAVRGRLGAVLAFDGMSLLFLVELGLFISAAWLLLRGRGGDGTLLRVAVLAITAGALYRFSTYLIAFRPVEGASYFPAVGELLITMGIIAFEIAAYLVIVKTLPILAGVPRTARPVPVPPGLRVPGPGMRTAPLAGKEA